MIGIAVNKIRQYCDNLDQKDEVDLLEDSIPDDKTLETEEELNQRERKQERITRKIEAVLNKVSKRYRTILQYAYLDNMPTSKIASEMDISKGNVRVLKHRALKKATEIANKILA